MTSERAVEARVNEIIAEYEADANSDTEEAALRRLALAFAQAEAHLTAARGEPPEPGPAIDVERLARAIADVTVTLGREWDGLYSGHAAEIAARYEALAEEES